MSFSTDVHFKCADGSLLGLIVGSMPQSMRDDLETAILTALGASSSSPILVSVDDPEKMGPFQAIHFAYYARNSEKVGVRKTHIVTRLLTTRYRVTQHHWMLILCSSSHGVLLGEPTIVR